jgi:uroporphyrinogen-III decarboxylase
MPWPDPLGESFRAAATDCVRRRGPYATVAMIRLGISATYISMGFEPFCLALLTNPGFVQQVMRRYTEWTARRVDYLQEIGFDVIWSFDDIAYKAGLMFSPQTLREVILPVVMPTIARIEVPWVFHSDGNLMPFMDELLELGMQGLNPLEPGAMDIRAVKQKYGSRLCLLGNVNVDALSRGTAEEVEREVLALLRDVAPLGGFVLTTGNSVPNYAIPENVAAMARALRRYGGYPIAA